MLPEVIKNETDTKLNESCFNSSPIVLDRGEKAIKVNKLFS